MSSLIVFIHLLALVLWVGGIITLAFIDTPAIFGTLPKEDAGNVVALIFPKFFWMGVITISLALITSYFIGITNTPYEKIKFFILIFMLILSLISKFYILPKARTLKSEIRTVEKKENLAELKKQFSQIHKFSVILLMINLISGLVTIFLISKQLELSVFKV